MDLGVPEILFIFILALLLFGPKKLPEIGKQIGKALAEFKRAKNEFTSQLNEEMRQLETQAEAKKDEPTILPPEKAAAAQESAPVITSVPPTPAAAESEAPTAAVPAKGYDA